MLIHLHNVEYQNVFKRDIKSTLSIRCIGTTDGML